MKKINYLLLPLIFFGLFSCNNTGNEKSDDKQNAQKETKQENKSADVELKGNDVPESAYPFGDLPYTSANLEPVISSEILNLHYDKHHKGYYKKFLAAIEGTE